MLAPNISATITTNIAIETIDITSAIGIQRGDVTHHQDQSMLPVSLSTKNTINSTDVILSPVPELLLDDAIIFN